ncbi:MAG TPA: histidine kinase, partial [Blastocatellia bacterium]|nr:histidine kinase [Blastocatellia bacterium]
MNDNGDNRLSPEAFLARLKEGERARLRVYIGAAPGVGKTFQMLEEAHLLEKQVVDVVIAVVETYKRADTEAMVGDLERVPPRRIEYRGVVLEEMDVEAVLARHPQVAIVDELAHTNVPGSKNHKRYEDVLDLLAAGISVITAVNVQHIESLNDVVARTTGVRVRETIPDCFLQRADEVVNVDVSVDTLRTRLRQGKIYGVEKIEQSLNNFFRKGNLSALRELALRQVAEDQASKAHDYREREGLGHAVIPEKVMVCITSRGNAKKLLRVGSRIAGRLASDWFAVYVESPREEPSRINPQDYN